MEEYFKKWREQEKNPDSHKGLSKSEIDEIASKFEMKRKKTSWSYWDVIGLIGSAVVLYAFSGSYHERGDTFSELVMLALIWIGVACAKSKNHGGRK